MVGRGKGGGIFALKGKQFLQRKQMPEGCFSNFTHAKRHLNWSVAVVTMTIREEMEEEIKDRGPFDVKSTCS